MNIAKRFGFSGDSPDDEYDNADVDVAVNKHKKIWSIVRRKSTNIGGTR